MIEIAAATPAAGRFTSGARAPRAAAKRPNGAGAHRATVEDWLRIPEEKRAELIDGRIVYHAFPGVKHGNTQGRLSRLLYPYDRRRTAGAGGGGGAGGPPDSPGGWWLSQEVDLLLDGVGCRPDVVGWRRDRLARVPQPNSQGVITDVPDFICEVLSPSTARYDNVQKQNAYFKAGVPHYWLVDPDSRLLTVLERTERGYLILLNAGPAQTVRAVPFEGVEIPVDELFLDEEGELPAEETAPSAPTSTPAPAPTRSRTRAATPQKRAGRQPR